MTTHTIYADSGDDSVKCISPTSYGDARSGAGSLSLAGSANLYLPAGQGLSGSTYFFYEGMLDFDTSSISDSALVSSVTLSLYGSYNGWTTAATLQARLNDFGATITTGDFVAGADLSSKTLLATFASSGWSTSGYNDMTSESAFVSSIDKTGNTRLLICTDRMVSGTTPTTHEYCTFRSADNTGTSQDPKLVVVAVDPASGTIAETLGAFSMSAAGEVDIEGSLAEALGVFEMSSSVVTSAPGETHGKIGGVWGTAVWKTRRNGVWVDPVSAWVNDSGTWKRVA